MIKIVENIEVSSNYNMTDIEIERLIKELKSEENEGRIIRIKVTKLGDCRKIVEYDVEPPKFERIRRITGYLTGTLNSWNDSKRMEEMDRVKHEIRVN